MARQISLNKLSNQPQFTIGKPIDNKFRTGDTPDSMREFILL
jgi:hypothetical protein